MRISKITVTILAMLLFVPTAFAHEGHAHHHVMGTVKAVDAQHVEVEGTDGKVVSLALDSNSKYVREKKAVTIADVKVGDRVVISFDEENGRKIARELQLGSKATTPHEHH